MEDLKITKTPSRLLSDFILTHKGAHVAYTSWSQGGAASEKNEPFMIVKSKEQVILSKEEQDLDEVKAAKEAELAELSKAIEVAKEEKVAAEASELEKALTEEKGKAEPTQSVTAEESASDINEVYQNFLKSKGIPTEESK